jgi:hypothetical protein
MARTQSAAIAILVRSAASGYADGLDEDHFVRFDSDNQWAANILGSGFDRGTGSAFSRRGNGTE